MEMLTKSVGASVLCVSLALAFSSSEGTTASASPPIQSAVDSELWGGEWAEAAADLQDVYGIEAEQAQVVVETQGARLEFREMIPETLGEVFAGLRFEPVTNTQVVLVTDVGLAEARARDVVADAGFPIRFEQARYSFSELQALVNEIESGERRVDPSLILNISVDHENNRVRILVDQKVESDFAALLDDLVAENIVEVVARVDDGSVPEVCTSKSSCGGPVRSGIIIWKDNDSVPWCSLGYSASASDGSRWIITAGHCPDGINQTWGHGDQAFGPVREIKDPTSAPTNVDVARIRLDSTYWKSWVADSLLLQINSSNVVQNAPSDIDYTLRYRSTINTGDPVCISARHARWGDSCGVINDLYGAHDMVRVGDYDACGGDSGGAWVWRQADGKYWGFGVHHGGRQGCPYLDNGGSNSSQGYSLFSAMPDIYAYWDDKHSATIRADD